MTGESRDFFRLLGQAANQLEVNTRTTSSGPSSACRPLPRPWYHNKVDRKGRTVYQVIKEAMQSADNEYLNALFKGGSLDNDTRNRIASGRRLNSAICSRNTGTSNRNAGTCNRNTGMGDLTSAVCVLTSGIDDLIAARGNLASAMRELNAANGRSGLLQGR